METGQYEGSLQLWVQKRNGCSRVRERLERKNDKEGWGPKGIKRLARPGLFLADLPEEREEESRV